MYSKKLLTRKILFSILIFALKWYTLVSFCSKYGILDFMEEICSQFEIKVAQAKF